jgi:hypothetical protein
MSLKARMRFKILPYTDSKYYTMRYYLSLQSAPFLDNTHNTYRKEDGWRKKLILSRCGSPWFLQVKFNSEKLFSSALSNMPTSCLNRRRIYVIVNGAVIPK